MASKKPYLDRHTFHGELTICKKQDDLTNKALSMFQLLSKETSGDFYFECNDDKKDAIAVAMHDLFKYWRNFKESNIVQLKVNRNFQPTEAVEVFIHGHKKLRYVAGRSYKPERRMFLIGKTINHTLKSLMDVIKEVDDKLLAIFIDKIKNKITLMDKFNGDDLSIKSYVVVKQKCIEMEVVSKLKASKTEYIPADAKTVKSEKKMIWLVDLDKKSGAIYKFKEPPNAFSYFTSIVRNGILKSINKINPKHFRNGKKISIDSINQQNNGMFNI